MNFSRKSIKDLTEIFRVFLNIGFLSFGGPAAQISLMHRLIVEDKKWLSEEKYLRALSFCMLLPGPEAMQLATYIGWKMKGALGGLIAGLLFVLPGASIVLTLAIIYAYYGSIPMLHSLFIGIKATVIVIVIQALIRVAKKSLVYKTHWVISMLAFVSLFFLSLPYPIVILFSALYGFFFLSHKEQSHNEIIKFKSVSIKTPFYLIAGLLIWFLPIVAVFYFSEYSILTELGIFFSKLSVVTFGGAYAVLVYMAQDVVSSGWLTASEMIDALGLAETTPGPLILVTEFVGFISSFRQGGIWLGIVGALITLWVTFVPCFIWIFTFAPYIEYISSKPKLFGALSAITAAVTGVILNLSIWFSIHVFFFDTISNKYGIFNFLLPNLETINYPAFFICILSAVALLWFKWNIILVIILSALLGLFFHTF